jgi:hypothetical protein
MMMTLDMDGANGWSSLLKMTHDMFRCWGFMSMAIHAHARTSELTVAHGNQQEPKTPATPKIRTIRIRPPTSVEVKRERCTMSLSLSRTSRTKQLSK